MIIHINHAMILVDHVEEEVHQKIIIVINVPKDIISFLDSQDYVLKKKNVPKNVLNAI
jgi:hypothetical protein